MLRSNFSSSHRSHSPCSFANSLRLSISISPISMVFFVSRPSAVRSLAASRLSVVSRLGTLPFFGFFISGISVFCFKPRPLGTLLAFKPCVDSFYFCIQRSTFRATPRVLSAGFWRSLNGDNVVAWIATLGTSRPDCSKATATAPAALRTTHRPIIVSLARPSHINSFRENAACASLSAFGFNRVPLRNDISSGAINPKHRPRS